MDIGSEGREQNSGWRKKRKEGERYPTRSSKQSGDMFPDLFEQRLLILTIFSVKHDPSEFTFQILSTRKNQLPDSSKP